MIRWLFGLLAFGLGLAGAGLWFGQMHHLRLAFPHSLPEWTGAVAADAGMRAGSMDLPEITGVPRLTLRWVAMRPDSTGLHWRVVVAGDGLKLGGVLSLTYADGGRARLSQGAGKLDLGRWPALGGRVAGQFTLTGLRLDLTGLTGAIAAEGDLDGRLEAVRIEGGGFGSGPLNGTIGTDDKWAVSANLDGGLSPVGIRVAGALTTTAADVDILFADGAALPDKLRAALSAAARPEAAGWRLKISLPLH